ncbi:MAG: hypothetical protein POELPBGB_00004 [Bacteroidia bacterium]|nr:hypothetical protein [Bacteroidia bacterium]
MDEELVRKVVNRLHRLIGHANKVDEMITGKRHPAEVLNQLLAVEGALYKLIYEQYDILVRLYIHERVNVLVIKQPHLAEELEQLHEQAFQLPLKKLPKLLYRLREIENQKQ